MPRSACATACWATSAAAQAERLLSVTSGYSDVCHVNLQEARAMRWTLTIKDQTFGVHTAISKYECRIARSGADIRLSFQNLSSGNVKEGRFLMPAAVARSLGSALLLACTAEGEHVDIVFHIDEGKAKG